MASTTAGRIGPNAVIQVAAALRALEGEATARRVFAAAGLTARLEEPPTVMTDEREVAALHRALAGALPETAAARAAAEAGRRTGDYILAHRIPKAAQLVLRIAPRPLAARLLLAAIARNAWTFAGSGRLTARPGRVCTVTIEANPIAVDGCVWHAAVLERLFRALVSRRTVVRETACCARGDRACHFEIDLAPPG